MRSAVDLVVLDIAGTTIEEHGAVYVALEDAVVAAGGRPGRADIEAWMGADKHQARRPARTPSWSRGCTRTSGGFSAPPTPTGRPPRSGRPAGAGAATRARGRYRPHHLVFRAMERLGIHHVARVLVAGDTTRDLEAGTNSGAGFVVGVLTGGQDAAALGAVRHTHLLPSAALLPELMLEAEATDHR